MRNLSPLLPDGQETLRGDGWNVGYTVGAQAHFGRWEFGASYKSAMDHDLGGKATVSGLLGPFAARNFSTGAKAHLTTPWIATVGARYHLKPQLYTVGASMKVRPNMTLDASGGYDAFRGSPVTTTTAFYPGAWSRSRSTSQPGSAATPRSRRWACVTTSRPDD